MAPFFENDIQILFTDSKAVDLPQQKEILVYMKARPNKKICIVPVTCFFFSLGSDMDLYIGLL